MTKILFVCLGNICRSTMAEFVMKDMVSRSGLSDMFYIESAGTSNEEFGNPVHPGTRRKLSQHGIDCSGKTARKMTVEDYGKFDLIIGMDSSNIRNIHRIFGGDPEHKVSMLLDYTDRPGEVADPWYTGNFEVTWQDVTEGCCGLLEHLGY